MPYIYQDTSFLNEGDLRNAGITRIAGCDEVGRGSLSGPVVVCCCMLPVDHGIEGVKDSKKLSEKKREELAPLIVSRALSISITMASAETIDKINIYDATKKCMYSAVENMKIAPEFVIIDGNFEFPNMAVPWMSVPGADSSQIYEVDEKGKKVLIGSHYENVAAASIVAKVLRDKMMVEYDEMWPEYSFKDHKGYLTKKHLEALQRFGPCPIHRRSFNGVA